MGVNKITPGKHFNAVSVVEPYSLVLIVVVGTYPPCGLNLIQQVANKHQSTSPGLVIQSQKLDAIVDVELPNDLDLTSIFSKIISHKLSDGPRRDVYICFRMNFVADPVQTKTPPFMDLEFLKIIALDY